jgi:RHH-type proline utilization regulon transcriptional repressor/proline dehydrogenase/delta 1-pyrroline-5-carboxylate dehydrogenase
MDELLPRIHALAVEAARHDIGLNIDAEEAARLDLSLDVIEALSGADELKGWDGFGVVVQAYQKRAPFVIDWLADMARRHGRRLMLRLVKGAYWDAEIKLSQELALPGYPVYTRKVNTDVAYLACARKLLAQRDVFYPQFATHNAHSIASVLEFAGSQGGFEFQRLHGMGEELYEGVVEDQRIGKPCRIYAPVGEHEDLLAYLVRRLLENGANSSFVNRIQDESLPVEAIIADPVAQVQALPYIPHPHIAQPRDLYGPGRTNFAGRDLFDRATLSELAEAMGAAEQVGWRAGPIVDGEQRERDAREVRNPADRNRIVGHASEATAEDIEQALASAQRHAAAWDATPVAERAAALRRVADLMEQEAPLLMAIAVREAGKTLVDALAEVREAVDFCRYYALRAEQDFVQPLRLRLPAGAGREARLRGGGVFCCISPWNFPLAIFTGQIAAALAAGNAVVAKPAEQTPLIAAAAVRLMHRAGIPAGVLHLLPGDGERVGGALVGDARVGGVCFTGSTAVAQLINRTLARRDGPLAPLIAETGGMNAMIVDSSALPEQVARDVVMSAFQSAGQRCSALRVLFVQQDVADKMLKMICGAMDELNVGDPALLATDIGPVIDDEAKGLLDKHIKRMRGEARLLKQVRPGPGSGNGSFVGPVAFEIDSLSRLKHEVFGPVLHVIRFAGDQIDSVVEAVNATGYGLTHGIHTRVDETRDFIVGRIRAGNTYVNRNQIGAVVGVQPFGGEGLSGTGPKAGGPHYLPRFASEVVDGALAGDAAPAAEAPALPDLSREQLGRALQAATAAAAAWSAQPVDARCSLLEKAAAALDAHDPAGAQGAGRAAEALRFYAAQAQAELAEPTALPGPTGERNELRHPPRRLVACLAASGSGVFALAAQCGAALAAGNSVVLWHEDGHVATELQRLLHEAGMPGGTVGVVASGADASLKDLIDDARIDAVALAGPHALAKALNRALAECGGAIRPLIPFALETHAGGAPGCPLAGSPAYLHRFVLERALSIDTTASGGNASLFTME